MNKYNPSYDVVGISVSAINTVAEISYIEKLMSINEANYVTFTNVHVIVTAKRNKNLHNALHNASLVSPDGMPLVWIGKLRGHKHIEKCSGPDMMKLLIDLSIKKGYSNYFYGSTPDTLDKLKSVLIRNYPDIIIKGMFSPPFRAMSTEEEKNIVEEINRLSPDFIWVCLGAPKQEIWMHYISKFLDRGVLFGVGAAFDFLSNNIKRAPVWMQKTGLEWLYRLLKEPKRLWKRYLVTNFLFVYYLIIEYIKKMIKR